MAEVLNKTGLEHAEQLIDEGRTALDERDAWGEDKPTSQEENEFIRAHGFGEYAKWFLAIDDTKPEDTKERYKFPYGDFKRVHRCALLAAESRAGEYKHFEIEGVASRLLRMLNFVKEA